MKKKGHRPVTRVKNPEPKMDDPDWIIWAAWADRITFEEIEKKTGKKESDVIKITNWTNKLELKSINWGKIKGKNIQALGLVPATKKPSLKKDKLLFSISSSLEILFGRDL